jgi:hypothetical protein
MLLISLVSAGPVSAEAPVVTSANLAFHSSFWMNLHHTLFGAAWARRPDTGGRRLIPALPAPLPSLPESDRAVWDAAVDFYVAQMADRDLRTGDGMTAIKHALAAERIESPAIEPALRAALESAAPVYRRHYWPAHDASNRAWIAATNQRWEAVQGEVMPRFARLYMRPWFQSPVRVDVVWVGRAYTTTGPTHTVFSPAEPRMADWAAVEIVLHEVGHELIHPNERALAEALGDRRGAYGDLWHAVHFYLSGVALQQILRDRGIDYDPYLYATGLFDRAWRGYRPAIERHWAAYIRGDISRAIAIERTMADLPSR